MLEMRAAVTHLDRIGHADPRERGALEGDGVGGGIPGIRVHVEIDQRAGAIFHRGETLIEITCCREAFTQFRRHRRAGLCMHREAFEDFGHFEPVLVELRGQFDEIARDIGARERGVGDVRQKPVQGVAKFVEQGARIIEGQKRRLALCGGREIHHIDDDRAHAFVQIALAAIARSPGAGALRGAREIIAVEQPHMRALRVKHLPGPDIGMIDGDIVARGRIAGRTGAAPRGRRP